MADSQLDSLKSLSYGGLPVLHLFHQFHSLGGVESVLRLHLEFDSSIGIQSDLIIYNDQPTYAKDRVHCLGIQPADSIRQIGQKLSIVTADRRRRAALYHLPWGFTYLCPHDHAHRRILIIHTETPNMKSFVRKNSRFLDGILCVNPGMRESVLTAVPSYPSKRIGTIGYPINPLGEPAVSLPVSDPIRLAFIGRLNVLQKRIDRIPKFCDALENLGVDYQLEIFGDGGDRQQLDETSSSHHYIFHGVRSGVDYWQHLRKLDCIVFFSDFEGTPISMLEAMSQGIIPIFPRIGCGGDAYVERVDPELLYPPGDLIAAARAVERLSKLSGDDIIALRARCRDQVKNHSVASYMQQIFDFTRSIWDMPGISTSSPPLAVKAFNFLTPGQVGALRKLSSA